MDLDEIVLQADDETVERLQRLQGLGITLQEMPLPANRVRTLMLVDRDGQILLTCLVRLEPVEQIREMLTIYDAILMPSATRH